MLLPRTIPLAAVERILCAAYQELKQARTAYALNSALRNAAMVELLFATGVRVSELCSLNADYVDLGNGKTWIFAASSECWGTVPSDDPDLYPSHRRKTKANPNRKTPAK